MSLPVKLPQWFLWVLLVVLFIFMYFMESSANPSDVLGNIEKKIKDLMRWVNRQ